jgi:polar amino acid transport system substrate-binding protein
MPDNSGLDIDLMTAIAEALGARVEFISYDGVDFNGIFHAHMRRRDALMRGAPSWSRLWVSGRCRLSR